jgi:hypothetical protein
VKQIIEAIKAFFSPKAPIVEVKKEVPYKIEPIAVEESSVKKKAKKKSVKKKTNELK